MYNKNDPILHSKYSLVLIVVLCLGVPLTIADAESEFCEVWKSYIAMDGLTVRLNSLVITEKVGSYEYTISYTLENNNVDKKILEGSFKMYYAEETDGVPQYGFFNDLFPGDTITRSYTFEELKNKPFGILEYHHNHFFSP